MVVVDLEVISLVDQDKEEDNNKMMSDKEWRIKEEDNRKGILKKGDKNSTLKKKYRNSKFIKSLITLYIDLKIVVLSVFKLLP